MSQSEIPRGPSRLSPHSSSSGGIKAGSKFARVGSLRSRGTRRSVASQLPNEDNRPSLSHFSHRNKNERIIDYRKETIISRALPSFNYQPNDAPDMLSRHPSFRKFRIPYEMICAKRYRDSRQAYETQLLREVNNQIDFQRTAADACYFVRCMAITSFWPPLHHMTEVKHTSKYFFRLSEDERWRLQNIMNTDIT
ncbi:hypothetical protein KR093_006078 [Drosophila rubida]|uniref:Uncharacterized protein n=1 Tax=Drosophila rubida TaxID=30044 RepID=A0AAD4JU24_9MUSC|nr:hypothetical protein KR093_006078 [Drosophila rubida]